MNSEFRFGLKLATTMAVASCFSDFFKAIIGPKLEKALGRKPTDWDWQVYWEESGKRAEIEASHKIFQEWQAQVASRRIIHDLVWNDIS